ncbi:MAG: hypothetical protein V1707_02070 [bacterium]
MEKAVISKLGKFLETHCFIEECEVVYLFVEMRKILDRKKSDYEGNDFLLVRFYADWIVHTKKSKYISEDIKKIMEDIDKDIKNRLENKSIYAISKKVPAPIAFIYGSILKEQIIKFFKSYGLPTVFLEDGGDDDNVYHYQDTRWLNLIQNLLSILQDQPIVRPIDSIQNICFKKGSAKNVVILEIQFNDNRGLQKLGNVF